MPLQVLLAANWRLHTAWLLKESLDQLCGYRRAWWTRPFFDRRKDARQGQNLAPFGQFAAKMEKNRGGIAACCTVAEKVSLGFVEGMNTKIPVIQRRAYGLRAEQYLRLKILTGMLPGP